MDRFPPAEDGPRYEVQSIGRSLNDLHPPLPPPSDVWQVAGWTLAGLVAVIGFMGLLIVGARLVP